MSTAADGDEGLSRAKTLPVDLIVLDGGLAMSGVVRRRLNAEAATSDVPVLWVGAPSPRMDFPPQPIADADRTLTLPFSFVQMRETANELLSLPS